MMMEGADPASYESVLAQNVQLKLDLQSALSELSRKQDDNITLRRLHESLQELYKRLQEDRDSLGRKLRQEQAEQFDSVRKVSAEAARLREHLREKCRECEDLQHQALAPQDLGRLRRRLEDELREAEVEPMRRQLEGKIAEEQNATAAARRQYEQEKARAQVTEAELKEKLESAESALRSKDLQLDSLRSQLEVQRQRADDVDSEVSTLQAQLDDLETQLRGAREQVKERESQSRKEQQVWQQTFAQKAEAERRTLHEVDRLRQQVLQEEEKLRKQMEAAEAQDEQIRALRARLDEAEVKVRATFMEKEKESRRLGEELSSVRSAAAAEKDRLLREVKVAEEKLQASELNARAAEAKHQQLEQDRLEALQEREEGLQQAELRRAAEVTELRTQLANLQGEVELRSKNFREREASLVKSVESAAARVQALSEELSACQAAQEETEKRLRETKDHDTEVKIRVSQLDGEASAMKLRVADLEAERNEQAAALRTAQSRLQGAEQQCRRLQEQLAQSSARLEADRLAWRRQADEVHAEVFKAEQQKYEAAISTQAEEHKRHYQRLVVERKKALAKVGELRARAHELRKRVAQLQSEKAAAIRLCEENKRYFEQRISEISLTGGGPRSSQIVEFPLGWREAPAGSPIRRRELQELAKNLEEHEQELRAALG